MPPDHPPAGTDESLITEEQDLREVEVGLIRFDGQVGCVDHAA
jgi:hypothetical protein